MSMANGARVERGEGRIEGVAVTDSFVFGSTVSICERRKGGGQAGAKREREEALLLIRIQRIG